MKEKDRDREANVVAAAIEALSAVASVLEWTHYQQLLGQFTRIMKKNDSKVELPSWYLYGSAPP